MKIIGWIAALSFVSAIIYMMRKEIVKAFTMDLTTDQIKNATTITKAMIDKGIKNPFLLAGILGIVKEESRLEPQSEKGYGKTSNTRIKEIFSKTRTLTDDQLTKLKSSDKDFFDFVYGGKFGNLNPGDGYKYRGRGFNQLTFADNYHIYGNRIGVNLISNPDLVNSPTIAAQVLACFFEDGIKRANKNPELLKKQYGVNDLTKIKSEDDASDIVTRINHGGVSVTGNFVSQIIKKIISDTKEFYIFTKQALA